MNPGVILGIVNVLCVGLLAGEEFVIRYGVRAPLASLDDPAHIRFRQALIYRLRILVPSIFVAALLTGIAATIVAGFVNGFDTAFGVRCAGVLALLTFITITLTGTVPINQAALTWAPAAPPKNWRAFVSRWERVDTWRTWAAITAFTLFLAALTLR
ncbi:MAG TPA: hypothetical protein VMV29_10280 [Ktedonobacterales bacterium]|nr:hypothetical protein [Ktedonobacterales bacterium]